MRNIIFTLLAAVLLTSCLGPIEGDETLGKVFPESEIQIDVHNITPGSNRIVMINNTPQLATFWDYIIGRSANLKDTVDIPFLGEQTITFVGQSAGGPSKTTRTVVIDRIDYPLDIMWELLAGDSEEGKTWVWATENPTPRGGYYPIFGNGSEDDPYPAWWMVYDDEMNDYGCLYDEMTFDLNGGANYTLVQKGKNGTGTPNTIKDSFVLDTTKKTLSTSSGTPFLRAEGSYPPPYKIKKLTENELTLIVTIDHDWGTEAAIWVFKRKGYEYPKP